jgi:hypothetical protein
MLVSFCVSRPRDATRRMSATELVCAAPSQQRLRRSSSSVAAALQPSTQVVVSSPRPSSRCCWQHVEEGRELRAASPPSQQHASITSVAAASAGDGPTAVSRDDERSTGAVLLKLYQDVHANCHHHFSYSRYVGTFLEKKSWVSLVGYCTSVL